MVNGCLAYGMPLTIKQFKNLVILLHDRNMINIDKKHPILYGKPCKDLEDYPYDIFDSFNNHVGIISIGRNGACCSVNKNKPYFVGLRSKGYWSNGLGSGPIIMYNYHEISKIDTFLRMYMPLISKKDKIPRYYIMAEDCDFCS